MPVLQPAPSADCGPATSLNLAVRNRGGNRGSGPPRGPGKPSKVKLRFPRARRAGIRHSGDGFRGVSGPRPKGKILESENANGPLSSLWHREDPRGGPPPPKMALELVCRAHFWGNRHCRTSPVVLEGFWGQVWPKIGQKQRKTKISYPPICPIEPY